MSFLIGPLAPFWRELGGGVCAPQRKEKRSRSRQLSSEWQLLGPQAWAPPSAQPSLSSAPLASDVPWAGVPRVNQEPFLSGSEPSLVPCSPLESLRDAPLPQFPLIILPLPPYPATASGTNSSNTARIEFPAL